MVTARAERGRSGVKRAILSDIHANLEALEAVLAHLHDQGVAGIYCLGDIIGYGPNPLECIDLAMRFDACLLGNHDRAVLFDPENFSRGAERAICWTREQLADGPRAPDMGQQRWDFLNELERNHHEDGVLFVHGSARNPLDEYVFPEDVYNRHKLEKIFALIQRHCFVGHTHVPGVLTAGGRFIAPQEAADGFRLGEEKVMVNVGSVGQPRDGDPRACYTLLEGETVSFHRVSYDVSITAEKIYAIAELDDFLGDRLTEGR
jgi:diadenosine tetraphosphatase ApaH/serine/threonine PP2A family protein phosphatase